MRWLPLLAVIVAAATGCGSTRNTATCADVNPQPPGIHIPTGSYAHFFTTPQSHCGRVFERSIIAMTEQQLKIRVIRIKCEEFGGGPSCYMETEHGCAAAIGLGRWREFLFRRVPASAARRLCSDLHSP